MKQISRYILTLVALFAMTAGAWAQENFVVSADFEDGNMPAGWDASQAYNTWYVDTEDYYGHAPAYSGTYSLYVDGNGTYEDDYFISPALEFAGAGSVSFAYATPSWDGDQNDLTVAYSTSPTGPWINTSFVRQTSENWTTATVDLSALNGTYYIAFISYDNYGYCTAIDNINITFPGTEVTFNADKTEASFDMPTYDLTVDYELVRDMSIDMPITVGDGNDGYRIRLKKNPQSGKFEPAETDVAGMMALIKVHDAIENEDLTFFNIGGAVDCSVNIYAIDAEDKPVGDPIAFPNLVPGRYIAKAVAATGSSYEGETALSNVFKLFEGYEVKIAPQSFATYYKDEPLKVDEETPTGELYTISSVTDNTVVLSEQIDAAPALTPLLVYNNSDEEKTILLLPQTTEPNVTLNVAPEFKGTLTEKTFTADDMAAADHYVLTVKNQFVWVKDAGTIAANKCWLEIVDGGSNSRSILFGDVTGIEANRQQPTANSLYDLNGRKLQKLPTRKGVYIQNGHKVVIK